MSEPDPLELAATIGATFDAVAVPYVLDGSLASTALGEPRATLDIDVAADLRDECIGDWLRLLGPDFSKDERRIRDEVRRRGSFQLVHRPTMTRVDVFVPEWTGVHLWKWQNRRRLVLDEQSQRGIDVTAPEGIVVQKLSWFRDGGATSERQWRDVLGVLKAQRDFLDRADMAVWARKMGVADLLERALVDAGLAGGGGRNARG